MRERLAQLLEASTPRDIVEIAILALALYGLMRLIGRTRGAGIVRGLGLVVVGFFLVAQVVIASLDLVVLGKVLDYILTTVLLGLLIIFQPELRHGLMVLGRYRILRFLVPEPQDSLAERLSDAALSMSSEFVGALIAIERETPLTPVVETGQQLDSEVSALLIQAIFSKRSPLHDGAVIVQDGRIAAAACQLPLGAPPESGVNMGMRHRSALAMSEETDAVLLVVSEETGRISLAIAGELEAVARDQLSHRLAEVLRDRTRIVPRPHRRAA